MEKLLGISNSSLKSYASVELIRAIVAMRSIKSEEEIQEIEKALEISSEMYNMVLKMAKPGVYEREISGRIEGIVGTYGRYISFPIILSIRGETLHNHDHSNRLKKGDLLVVDSEYQKMFHHIFLQWVSH